jgi:hypothetical protein
MSDIIDLFGLTIKDGITAGKKWLLIVSVSTSIVDIVCDAVVFSTVFTSDDTTVSQSIRSQH